MSAASTITIDLPSPSPSSKPAPKPQSLALPPRPEVLIVASADGHLEIYANRPMRVHVAERLAVEPSSEIAADEHLDMTLPQWAREIYYPWDLATCHTVRPRTVAEEIGRQLSVDLVRCAAEITSAPSQIPLEIF